MAAGSWLKSDILVSLYDQSGMAGEQFRKLQVKLRALKSATAGKLCSIVVTSPLMGEGKTACAANLALAFSHEPERRVLLLDCDIRKPRIHAYLDVTPSRGILDILDGRSTVKEAAVTMPGGTLDVIALPPGGSNNGSRPHGLPMEKLKDLLRRLAPQYEFIVCDSPPLLPTADAGGLVDVCDGALMVIRAGITPRPAAAQALAGIDKKKLIGLLLNCVPESRMGRHYYYKYYAEVDDRK